MRQPILFRAKEGMNRSQPFDSSWHACGVASAEAMPWAFSDACRSRTGRRMPALFPVSPGFVLVCGGATAQSHNSRVTCTKLFARSIGVIHIGVAHFASAHHFCLRRTCAGDAFARAQGRADFKATSLPIAVHEPFGRSPITIGAPFGRQPSMRAGINCTTVYRGRQGCSTAHVMFQRAGIRHPRPEKSPRNRIRFRNL